MLYNEFLQSVRPVTSWSHLPNTSYECKKYLTQANTYQSPSRELNTPRAWYYDTDLPELAGDTLGIIEEEPSFENGQRLISSCSKVRHQSVSRLCHSNHKPVEKGEWDRPKSFIEKNKYGAFNKKPRADTADKKKRFKWELSLRSEEDAPPVDPPKSTKKKISKKKPKRVDSGLIIEDPVLTKEKSPFKRFSKSKAETGSRSKTESKWVKKSSKDLAANSEPTSEPEISPEKSTPVDPDDTQRKIDLDR